MKEMKVKCTWEFTADLSGIMQEYVDLEGLAKDLAERELQFLLEHGELSAEDFCYEIQETEEEKKGGYTV